MNNEKTSITYEKVQEHAETVRTCAKAMNDIFDQYTIIMNTLAGTDVFVGLASESLQEEFSRIKGKLISYSEKVNTFSDLIKHEGDTTQAMEERIARQAQELTTL